jgi:hypothetical protein
MLFGSEDLHINRFEGCLLVVWEIGGLPTPQIGGWVAELPTPPSAQVACFLVADAQQTLAFHDFLALIDRDFAGMGDFTACLESLRAWCGLAPASGAPDLGLPFVKRPSRWLRDLKHDFIVNTVLINRASFEELGLLRAEREIDYIGSVLRNLLCTSESRISVRGLLAESEAEESMLYQLVYSTPCRMVAPASLAATLAAEYKEGVDFMLYQTPEAAAEFLDAAGQEGCARILFQTLGVSLPEVRPVTHGPAELPTVLVAEPAPQKTWREWQAQLAGNMVGSYSVSGLDGRRSGKRVVAAQRPYWRACAFLALPSLFDRLIELLIQTHVAVKRGAPRLEERTFRSLVAIGSAKAVYLGQSVTGDGD